MPERNHEQARRLFEENLTFSAEVGDKTRIAYCLEGWQRSPRRKTDWCTQRDCGDTRGAPRNYRGHGVPLCARPLPIPGAGRRRAHPARRAYVGESVD